MAIPFVRIDASQNPNLAVRKGQDSAEPYFKAMTVAFASLRRWHPTAKLEFVSNAEPPVAFQGYFASLGVNFRQVPFDHEPPIGFADRFVASLYLLDTLNALDAEQTVIMDPDVLCVGDLNKMLDDIGDKVGVLPMNFPPEENINGINRIQAGQLHALLGEPHAAPPHFGGEIYVVSKRHLKQIQDRCEEAWQLALLRHSAGLTKFTTEEHILSYALRVMPWRNLDLHVRRIWTAHKYRLVHGDEDKLALWHLPAEKDRGFASLFPIVLDEESWFWAAEREDFVSRAGRAMGLHHRTPARWAKDTLGYVLRAVVTARLRLSSK